MPNFAAHSDIFTWVILPLLIFAARICDVSIGTLRIIYLARGKKLLAPLLGFFEIIIWLLAIGQIFQHLDNIACYVAYAGGFAAGNFVGIWLENKLALGMQVVRIITSRDAAKLLNSLREEGFGITEVNARGNTGAVKIIFTLIRRKDLSKVAGLIQDYNPNAFFSVEDVRMASAGIFPGTSNRDRLQFNWLKMVRKAK